MKDNDYNEYLDHCQDLANAYLCDLPPRKGLRVVNWYKWNRAKKRLGSTLLLTGIFLGFGVESSLMWGVVGIPIAFTGALVLNTVDY